MNDLFEGYIMLLTSRMNRSKHRSKIMDNNQSIRDTNDAIKYLRSAQEAFNKGDTHVSLEYLEMVPNWLREGNWQTLRTELQ